LTVADAGVGFPEERRSPRAESHFGLSHLSKRLSALGGLLEINSSPDEGTRISLLAPAGELSEMTAS